ncbi:hypothetical protein SAMN05444274_108129 [Mariniphaga anaerophila]|uniref:Glycoamylase-like domain-containing protein n=2 Tax=Mariniphaga anaerophila TaxID=1484053 RepID=A0A1M5E8M1_9BACT|nr:hypothetical protein SAMN05444274_108129 [Mariniphaga anaerophila]
MANPEKLNITYVYVGKTTLTTNESNNNISIDELIEIRFNKPVNQASAEDNIRLVDENNQPVETVLSFFSQNSLVKIEHPAFSENSTYRLIISSHLKGEENESFVETIYTFSTLTRPLVLESITIDEKPARESVKLQEISLQPEIKMVFSHPLSLESLKNNIQFKSRGAVLDIQLTAEEENIFVAKPVANLEGFVINNFTISNKLKTADGSLFEGFETNFYTQADLTPKFPAISDDELLTLIQKQTFKYFWDLAHPVSGLARERNNSGETVTIGGSGFGLMTIIVGIERGFITRSEGVDRLKTIVDFLGKADRFHGVWPHWLNGTTGKTRPFGTKDDGGDLVETSFMAAGLLAVRQYLDSSKEDENALIGKINDLWNGIEWDWHTRGGQNVLYWHWSPNYGWDMNMKISGYNEALITYIMAASSETHTIGADVYHQGWARNGAIKNGKSFYGIPLPVGFDYGGPLFFAHYSFLGINPHNLSDQYANYWEQNRNHTLINRAHCVQNPNNFVGYSEECWGLTASDNHNGYLAHSPTNDIGVITPTAAISSIPFTPEESMEAIRFFYYVLGDRLWGEYGFYDAFNVTESWTASSFLAIDQGPIIIMIENHRTGLVWDLLMSAPEVQAGLTKLGFSY